VPPPLHREEKIFLLILFTVIAVVTGVAFVLLGVVAHTYYNAPVSSNLAAGSVTFFGAGILAYTFGLRHGVDADHIAAIDNTTRKLMADGKRPLTVGTWFSLGHSTIVFVLSIGIVLAANYVNSHIGAIQSIGQILGTAISGGFLYLIGIINLIIVLEVYRIFKKLRTGRMNEAELEDHLRNRGFMNRYFGRMFNLVQTPRQVYPVGVLFGLGFDTASEIFLLGTVAVLGLAGAPVYVVLVLPLLFTCGMVLVDTADGATMRYAYGWAFHRPVRKIFYNLTVTIISVLVAFVIGTVELLQVLAIELGWSGPFWSALVHLEFETLGYFVIGTFVLTWAIATAVYRIKRYDSIEVATPSEPT
jgi:high-affinity nickel-transport protein